MCVEDAAEAAEDIDQLLDDGHVLVEEASVVAHLRNGRVLPSAENLLRATSIIEIPRPVVSIDLAARLAEMIYLQVVRDTAATVASLFLRDLMAPSARAYASTTLEILLAAEAATDDNVDACRADLEKWFGMLFGHPSSAVLVYHSDRDEPALIEYRNTLSMLILALRYPL